MSFNQHQGTTNSVVKRLNPFSNWDAWYASQPKNEPKKLCIKCREYWKRKPVVVQELSRVCRQCTFVWYSKGFTLRGRLTLDRVDASKLGRWELFIYKKLKALHR